MNSQTNYYNIYYTLPRYQVSDQRPTCLPQPFLLKRGGNNPDDKTEESAIVEESGETAKEKKRLRQ